MLVRAPGSVRLTIWVLAWVFPLAIFVTGITLTAVGDITVWHLIASAKGVDTEESRILAVWPAGLVLLGAGSLGIMATTLAVGLTFSATPRQCSVAAQQPTS